jgi:putative methylase
MSWWFQHFLVQTDLASFFNIADLQIFMNKKQIAILLSQLRVFDKANAQLEQYPTDSEVASDALWLAHMLGDLNGKTVLDLGAGTGVLSIGALLLGAKSATLVEVDASALDIAKENKAFIEEKIGKKLEMSFVNSNVLECALKSDVVLMNPPFGTRDEHIDSKFLLKAFEMGRVIYSFHKDGTGKHIDRLIEQNGFEKTHHLRFSFPLKQTMSHHTKKIERIDVGLWRAEKK